MPAVVAFRRGPCVIQMVAGSSCENSTLEANLFVLAVLTATIVYAPIALADDINPDADVPDISTLADSPARIRVLQKIPQAM